MLPFAWWRHDGAVGAVVLGLLVALLWVMLIRLVVRTQGAAMVALAVTIGLALRIAATRLAAGSSLANDPLSYSTLAQALLDGRGLTAWGLRAHYPPLYPLLLAGVARVAGSIPVAALAVNIVADSCAALLLWRIARRSLSERFAIAAGAVYFLWPALLVDGGVAQKEGLALALALGAMLAGVRCFESDRWAAHAAVLGVMWGLLGLCQPALVTLPPIICLALAARRRRWRRLVRVMATAALAFALTMASWWIRNFLWFGQFVPFTTAGGLMFLGPLGEAAILGAGSLPIGEAAQAGWTTRHALRAIVADPLSYGGHALFHAARAMLLDVGAAEQFFWFNPVRRPSLLIALMTACQASWCLLWGVAAAGARRLSGVHLALLASVAVQFAAISMWLQFHERHRLVLMPLLIMVAMRAGRTAVLASPAVDPD